MTEARRLFCCPKGDATLDMIRVLKELPLTYPMPAERRWGCSASAVHERRPAGAPYHASSTAPTRPSARAIPSPRSPDSSTPRVRLHLKPGQKGTKHRLAQYGDRLICVRYRYDAQRKKRLKTVELLVAERDWDPPRPPFAQDQIVGIRVAFANVAARDRVKQAGSTWNPEQRVWQLRYDHVVALGLHARIADEPASNTRCPTPSRGHLHADARPPSLERDARIYWWMPASSGRCRRLQSNGSSPHYEQPSPAVPSRRGG